eukprot:3609007-Alexandrium_andersonii.AAC.1
MLMLVQRRGASERVESWSGSCLPMASAPADARTVGSAIWTFGTSMLLGPRFSWASLGPPCCAGPGRSGSVRPLLPPLPLRKERARTSRIQAWRHRVASSWYSTKAEAA